MISNNNMIQNNNNNNKNFNNKSLTFIYNIPSPWQKKISLPPPTYNSTIKQSLLNADLIMNNKGTNLYTFSWKDYTYDKDTCSEPDRW